MLRRCSTNRCGGSSRGPWRSNRTGGSIPPSPNSLLIRPSSMIRPSLMTSSRGRSGALQPLRTSYHSGLVSLPSAGSRFAKDADQPDNLMRVPCAKFACSASVIHPTCGGKVGTRIYLLLYLSHQVKTQTKLIKHSIDIREGTGPCIRTPHLHDLNSFYYCVPKH